VPERYQPFRQLSCFSRSPKDQNSHLSALPAADFARAAQEAQEGRAP
jgi:hypothetical protein